MDPMYDLHYWGKQRREEALRDGIHRLHRLSHHLWRLRQNLQRRRSGRLRDEAANRLSSAPAIGARGARSEVGPLKGACLPSSGYAPTMRMRRNLIRAAGHRLWTLVA
jgi:hypothetical protein